MIDGSGIIFDVIFDVISLSYLAMGGMKDNVKPTLSYYVQTERQTDRRTDIQTFGQTDKGETPTDRQTGRQTNKQRLLLACCILNQTNKQYKVSSKEIKYLVIL